MLMLVVFFLCRMLLQSFKTGKLLFTLQRPWNKFLCFSLSLTGLPQVQLVASFFMLQESIIHLPAFLCCGIFHYCFQLPSLPSVRISYISTLAMTLSRSMSHTQDEPCDFLWLMECMWTWFMPLQTAAYVCCAIWFRLLLLRSAMRTGPW